MFIRAEIDAHELLEFSAVELVGDASGSYGLADILFNLLGVTLPQNAETVGNLFEMVIDDEQGDVEGCMAEFLRSVEQRGILEDLRKAIDVELESRATPTMEEKNA